MKAPSQPTTPRAKRSPKAPRSNGNGHGELARQIPKRWRWHFDTLTTLLDEQMRVRARHLAGVAAPIQRYSMHQADSASDEFDQEFALSQLSAEQDALYEIESAIERIAHGTYGVCVETGVPISEARLKAIPWTRYCKEAKERLENGAPADRRRLGALRSLRDDSEVMLAESAGSEGPVREAEPSED